MDCQTAREISPRLLEWDLSAREQADLQLHLDACPDCRADLDAYWALHRAFAHLRENPLEPPRDLALNVMREAYAAPPLMLMVRRTKAGFLRRLEEIAMVFKTPGRMRTALSAAALALVAVVAVGSLYLNNMGTLTNVAVNHNQTAVTGPVVSQPTVPANPQPTPVKVSPPANAAQAPEVQTELASASTGTMTSVWVDAKDLDALNREFSTVAGQHKADYQVYSLNNMPNGQNKEIVRITVGPDAAPGVTDRILAGAAAVGRVVNTVTSTGSDGQNVITAFVTGPTR